MDKLKLKLKLKELVLFALAQKEQRMSELDRFIKALTNYINITLRDSLKIEETYDVSIYNDTIILKAILPHSGPAKLMTKITYENLGALIEKTLSPSIAKIFPYSLGYGFYIDLDYNNRIIKFIPRVELYLDLIPYDLLPIILENNTKENIKSVMGISTRNMESIYEDIIKYIDLIQTGGKLWKWVAPLEGRHFLPSEYIDLHNTLKYTMHNIIRTNDELPRSKWNNKKIVDFLLDTTANFDSVNGYPRISLRKYPNKFIFDDYYGYSVLIKMRQFYSHFIGVQHEKRFAAEVYEIKSTIEDMKDSDDYIDLPESIKRTMDQVLNYIETGIIKEPFEDLSLFIKRDLSDTGYFFNNLLNDPSMKYKNFDQYIQNLKYLNNYLFDEYKKHISTENLEKIKSYNTPGAQLILQKLLN